jgi:hypothetical protein
MYYDLKEIDYGQKRVSVSINRSGGGLACTVTAKLETDERVEMTHGTQHVAGLTEIFTIRKKEVLGGFHRNSMKYRNFWGKVEADTRVSLTCEVKNANNNEFYRVDYELSLESKAEKKT